MKLAIASDHGGLELKQFLVEKLKETHQVLDLGVHNHQSVDYPNYAALVAHAVLEGQAERGILVCGSGIGMSIAANKIPGIRASVVHDCYSARLSVEHNNLNVLTLGGRVIGPELALEVVTVWLAAQFAGGRHQHRLDLIGQLEKTGA